MTERVEPANRGRDTGWGNDEPTALRKGGDGMDGVRRVVTDANIDDNNFKNNKNTFTRSKDIYVGPTIKNIKRIGLEYGLDAEAVGTSQNLDRFDEILGELKRRVKNGRLRHDEDNVKLILEAIKRSPPSELYPHPLISKILRNKCRTCMRMGIMWHRGLDSVIEGSNLREIHLRGRFMVYMGGSRPLHVAHTCWISPKLGVQLYLWTLKST